jgi:uncharacterized repeat protein (TIGR03803 family)
MSALGVAAAAHDAPMEKVVYSFGGGSDGGIPYAGLTYHHGAYYGATDIGGGSGCGGVGCGYVYSLAAPAKRQSTWVKVTLYAFAGDTDGAFPQGQIAFDGKGNLYGTTTGGGRSGFGTVFRLAPPPRGGTAWTETVLHSFTGHNGATPHGALILDQAGAVYGTTEYGGKGDQGVVFRLVPPETGQPKWSEYVLYNFTGGTDGAVPLGGLLADKAGNLLGTTSGGGTSGLGTVFRLAPPASPYDEWTETVLHAFAGGRDGALPVTGLIADTRGNLYGPTTQGGTGHCAEENGCGTIFRLAAAAPEHNEWQESVLHSFAGGSDGSFANSTLAIGRDGELFGATQTGGGSGCGGTGCGVIFSLARTGEAHAAWAEQIVKQFSGGADGAYPNSIVIAPHDATILGTTGQGGIQGCDQLTCGVVFELTRQGDR